MNRRCIIIAGGDVEISRLKAFLCEDDFVIAADSGYRYCQNLNIIPDLLVGDFDSYIGELPKNLNVVKLPKQKDDTDLLYALRCGVERCFLEFVIFGGYGSRPDQSFAMYQSLLWLKNNQPNASCLAVCNGFEVTVLKNEKTDLFVGENRYISVFAFGGEAVVDISGASYSVSDYKLTPDFPIGVSNEAVYSCTINVKSGAVLVMSVDKNI